MDRRVLMTGATGALGASVVRRFLAAGDRVLAVGERESALAEVATLGAAGAVQTYRADLSSEQEVGGLFAAWHDAGDVPTVVHLVGGFRFGQLAQMSAEDWSFLLRVNLEVTWRIVQAAAVRFAEARAGCLVAVSSPAALTGAAGVGAYAATKAGALRLVESLAQEIAAFGGRANTVLPGTMDTPANRAAMPATDPQTWVSTDAVAEVIQFLASREARGINGAAVRVEAAGR
jgi:NAD(P)-dependent dehydrogenase (short-subunit alcohol dehydrogenase family)